MEPIIVSEYIEKMKEKTKETNRTYFLKDFKKKNDDCFTGKYLSYKIYNGNNKHRYDYDIENTEENNEEKNKENNKEKNKEKRKETLRRCLNRKVVYRTVFSKSDEVIMITQPFDVRIVTPLTKNYRPPNLPEEWWICKEYTNSFGDDGTLYGYHTKPRGYRVQIYSVINVINVRTVYWLEKCAIEDDKKENKLWRRMIMSHHLSEEAPFKFDKIDELFFDGEDD
jgi:hypothetical protein